MKEKSTFLWSIARTENFLIESIDKDVLDKKKLQEFFIRFYQHSST